MPGCVQIRGLAVHFHLIFDQEGVYLIDGGFVGAVSRLESVLREIDRDFSDIRAILLTHGHLDHTCNIARIQELSGASVYAPKFDEDHVMGRQNYRGISRACGILEMIGRTLTGFRPPEIDHWFEDDDWLDFWGGLRVIGLPGHTLGHCGFYAEERRLLFSADLFSNYWGLARRPPPWFNTHPNLIDSSLKAAVELELSGVLPNHSRCQSPEDHLESLRNLVTGL